MEEALGAEQIKIGQRVADSKLKIETLGKVGTYCTARTARLVDTLCQSLTTWAGRRQQELTIHYLARAS
jgi:hypothetical protein